MKLFCGVCYNVGMNKVVLITGGNGGIGSATAKKFASQGYDVAINYFTHEEKAADVKNSLESEYGIRAEIYQADVADEAAVSCMVSKIKDDFGKIDVLVNNAGIAYDRDFDDIKIAEFKRVLAVNVMGAFIVAREAVKIMGGGLLLMYHLLMGPKRYLRNA